MSLRMFQILTTIGVAVLFTLNLPAKIKPAAEPSGRDIFMDRCSACHGQDGKGNGPAVGSLKVAPGDLTGLAARNGGTFPEERVKNIVGGWANLSVHGSREMPIWGTLFVAKTPADQQSAAERFKSLASYLKSIQE